MHHDLWDFDLPNAPKLMTIDKDGKPIPVVILAAKHGFVFVFDRRTGAPVWPIEERAGAAERRAGRAFVADAAVPDLAAAVRAAELHRGGHQSLRPGRGPGEDPRDPAHQSRNEGLFTPPSLQGSISMPGHNGGVSWGGSAVDPVNKRFFVVSREIPVLNVLKAPERAEASEGCRTGGRTTWPTTRRTTS